MCARRDGVHAVNDYSPTAATDSESDGAVAVGRFSTAGSVISHFESNWDMVAGPAGRRGTAGSLPVSSSTYSGCSS